MNISSYFQNENDPITLTNVWSDQKIGTQILLDPSNEVSRIIYFEIRDGIEKERNTTLEESHQELIQSNTNPLKFSSDRRKCCEPKKKKKEEKRTVQHA